METETVVAGDPQRGQQDLTHHPQLPKGTP